MQLKSLTLRNFRLFQSLDLLTPQQVILITGNNAQGKTSILEAIYYLATFSSFHASTDRQLIRFSAHNTGMEPAVAHIKADFESGTSTRHMEVRLILQPDRNGSPRFFKEILLDNARKKVNEALGKFNAVLFLPGMTEIIDGSPEQRRRYLNTMIAQANPSYVDFLIQYNQSIQQRNALLKILAEKRSAVSQLDIWDEKIARAGARIIHERDRVIYELRNEAQFIHQALSHDLESLQVVYQPSFDPAKPNNTPYEPGLFKPEQSASFTNRSHISVDEIEKLFFNQLLVVRKLDISRGVSSIGPHRDEIRFLCNSTDLGIYGSRGQIRTALTSVKFAEAKWLKKKTGQLPVMLLDEVLAEIDERRRHDLLHFLEEGNQTFLTTTDMNLFTSEYIDRCKVWHIQHGMVFDRNPSEITPPAADA